MITQCAGQITNNMSHCGILLVATRKYKSFVRPLLEQIDKFFLPKEELTVFLFTDEEFIYNEQDYDFDVKWFIIPPLKFPFATLYRYRVIAEHADEMQDCSHLFYLDVDSKIVDVIGEEILGDGLTVTRHPGFFGLGGWGANEVNPTSKAFIPVEKRERYCAGGFNGGRADVFLQMCKELSENISDDESRGIIAQHNDEAHMNSYLVVHPEIQRIELHSGYTMVESEYLRKGWKIDHLPVFIIALDKDHKSIRE